MASLGSSLDAIFAEGAIPLCNPTPCAPCYYAFGSSTIKFPYDVANETQTVSLVAYVTDVPNGTPITSYSTVNPTPADEAADAAFTYLPSFVWEHNGVSLTYPTSYLSVFDFSGTATAGRPPKSDETCNPTTGLSSINLPSTADPASLIVPIDPTQTSLTTADASALGIPSLTNSNDLMMAPSFTTRTIKAGESVRSLLPDPVLHYLDEFTTVRQQFSNVPLSSCLPAEEVSQPSMCLTITTRTGLCTGVPKNATSVCTSVSTSTRTKPVFGITVTANDGSNEDGASEYPSTIARKTARALVYDIRTIAAADPFKTPASTPESTQEGKAEENGNKQETSEDAIPSPAPFNEETSTPTDGDAAPKNIASPSSSADSPDDMKDAPSAGPFSSASKAQKTASPKAESVTEIGQQGGDAPDGYIPERSTTLSVPSFTLGGTVYTAAETLTSDQGLGAYIYSGIGGSGPAGTVETSASLSNATGVVAFTGRGSRSRLSAWVGYILLSTIVAVLR